MPPGPEGRAGNADSGIRDGGRRRIRGRGRRKHQRYLEKVFLLTQDGLRGIQTVGFRCGHAGRGRLRLGFGHPSGGHNWPGRLSRGGKVAIAVDTEQPEDQAQAHAAVTHGSVLRSGRKLTGFNFLAWPVRRLCRVRPWRKEGAGRRDCAREESWHGQDCNARLGPVKQRVQEKAWLGRGRQTGWVSGNRPESVRCKPGPAGHRGYVHTSAETDLNLFAASPAPHRREGSSGGSGRSSNRHATGGPRHVPSTAVGFGRSETWRRAGTAGR
jgi:hypothetical protein